MTSSRSRPDWNLLLALGALLEERNVTHAAARLRVSQPAMSTSLARLRAHFDDELLERVGRFYRLTPLAEELLPSVQHALQDVECALSPGVAFDAATSGRRFTITLSDYALSVLAEPLLGVLAEKAPGITVEFDPLAVNGSDQLSHLSRHDVLIGALGCKFPGKRRVLFRDRFVCIVDAAHPRLRDGALTWQDLGAMAHATVSYGPGSNTQAGRVLAEHGISQQAAVTVQGMLQLPFVVAGTDMCAFVPERLARRAAQLVDITIARTPLEAAELVEAAHWHPARAADPAVIWLLDILRETATRIAEPSPETAN